MKLLKPSWINHDGHPIFSVDIHPNTPRFATGGQGADSMGRVVIWGMGSIEFPDNPHPPPMAKFLCQLDHHSACVNCVRWSNKGKYLASGGDDKIIMIWELKGNPALHAVPTNQNSCFGKSAHETWKPTYTLRCHTGDILDLAWSPDDRYLASASVDNKVLIWDALKFPRILKEIQGHSSLVKGVTWDPVGNYLATQSDDQTLKIWRTSDWKLEHTVTESFAECGGTTHVLRLDWSPDGGYLVTAHAMNCGGPTAQIVERDGWKTDKDFVGHRKAVVCVRFTRTMLQKGKSQLCYVALGSRDRSLSIWSTALKRPLVVIRDAFMNSVMDLAWSSDAKMMMACSGDGTVTIATFSKDEIGDPFNQEEMISLHQRLYGKKLNYLSNSSDQLVQSVEVFMARKRAESITAAVDLSLILEDIEPVEVAKKETSDMVIRGPIDKQIETRTADGKRRITPKFLLPQNDVGLPAFQTSEEVVFGETRIVNDAAVNLRNNMVSGIDEVRTLSEPPAPAATIVTDMGKQISTKGEEAMSIGTPQKKRILPIRIEDGIPNLNGTSKEIDHLPAQPLTNGLSTSNHNGDTNPLLSKVPEKDDGSREGISENSTLDHRVSVALKRRKDAEESKNASLIPPNKIIKRGIGLNEASKNTNVGSVPVVSSSTQPTVPSVQNVAIPVMRGRLLTPLKIEDSFISKVQIQPDSSFQLEVDNGVNGSNWLKCQHSRSSFDGLYWAISTDTPICVVAGDRHRIVAGCEDGTVHILDLKGRYTLPPYLIPSLPTKLCLSGAFLLIVTVRATVHVWNIHNYKSIIKSESILSLLNLNNTESVNAFQITIMSDGAPLVILSNGKKFLFNFDMQTWVSITESSQSLANLRKSFQGVQTDSMLKKENSITFIKLRLASALQLLKVQDVQKSLVVLAKALAAKGCKRELHLLCEDLLGPTHSSAASTPSRDPHFGGVDKRKVLREILTMLLADLQWQDFYLEFDEMLQLVERGGETNSFTANIPNSTGNSSRF